MVKCFELREQGSGFVVQGSRFSVSEFEGFACRLDHGNTPKPQTLHYRSEVDETLGGLVTEAREQLPSEEGTT